MLHDLSKQQEADQAMDFLNAEMLRGSTVRIEIVKAHNQRTVRQNAALHKMLMDLADELNNRGLYMMKVLRHDAEIEWTPEAVKEFIYRPVMKAQTGKTSTTRLTTKEIDAVFQTLNKHFGEKFDIELEWPSIESLINKERI